jgi:hypothetical protein
VACSQLGGEGFGILLRERERVYEGKIHVIAVVELQLAMVVMSRVVLVVVGLSWCRMWRGNATESIRVFKLSKAAL